MTAASIGLSAKHSLRCLNTAQFIGRSALHCVLFGIKSFFERHLADDVDNPQDDNKRQNSEIRMSCCVQLTAQVLILAAGSTNR